MTPEEQKRELIRKMLQAGAGDSPMAALRGVSSVAAASGFPEALRVDAAPYVFQGQGYQGAMRGAMHDALGSEDRTIVNRYMDDGASPSDAYSSLQALGLNSEGREFYDLAIRNGGLAVGDVGDWMGQFESLPASVRDAAWRKMYMHGMGPEEAISEAIGEDQ